MSAASTYIELIEEKDEGEEARGENKRMDKEKKRKKEIRIF